MRYFDEQEAVELNAEPWQIDLLKANPSYCSWGPHEDYMWTKGDGWNSAVIVPTWADFGWGLDDFNECANFYFEVSRPSEQCGLCGGNGYHPDAQQVARTFYSHSCLPGETAWNAAITEDEAAALIEACRADPGDTAESINAKNGPSGLLFDSHDAINRMILIRARLKRLGLHDTCPDCNGNGYVYTANKAKVALVLWWLHPRKGCSRGVEISDISRDDLGAVRRFLSDAADRNAARFAGVGLLPASAIDARSGETAGLDPKGESAVAASQTPNLLPPAPNRSMRGRMMSEMKTYWICWNADRTEGFITDEEADAKSCKSGKPHRKLGYPSQSTAGEAFHECYGGEITIEKGVSLRATAQKDAAVLARASGLDAPMTADTRPAPPIPASVEGRTGWQSCDNIPRDGSWFMACTMIDHRPTQVRVVHFAARDDRLPISHDSEAWSRLPTHWKRLPEALASQSAKLIEAERDRDEWRNRGDGALKQIDAMHCRALAAEAKLAKAVRAIDSISAWLLHRFGPDSPEGTEAVTARSALPQSGGLA